MITIEHLVKKFGGQVAVNIEDVSLKSGEVVGLVGNNGAGKTTLMRLIMDLTRADEGRILSKGRNVALSEEWKLYTSAYIDSGFLVEFLTAEEYFQFIGRCHDLNKKEVEERLCDFDRFLGGEILGNNKIIKNFSAGNKQKAGIVGAMMLRPDFLLLDEPFNFLDPSSQVEMRRLLLDCNHRFGTTMLLSSHNLEHITEVSTRILLMEKGLLLKDLDNHDKLAYETLNKYFE